MLKRIVEFFTGKKEPVVQAPVVPYKVEAPAPVPVPEPAAVPLVTDQAAEASAVTLPPAANTPPAKKPAAKKPAAPKKPAAIKAPAKPRTKKTT